jgi:hypothetical protein
MFLSNDKTVKKLNIFVIIANSVISESRKASGSWIPDLDFVSSGMTTNVLFQFVWHSSKQPMVSKLNQS